MLTVGSTVVPPTLIIETPFIFCELFYYSVSNYTSGIQPGVREDILGGT
jgi:hypothetical protein